MTIKKTVTGSLTEAELITLLEAQAGFKVSNLIVTVEAINDAQESRGFRPKTIIFDVDESQPVRQMHIVWEAGNPNNRALKAQPALRLINPMKTLLLALLLAATCGTWGCSQSVAPAVAPNPNPASGYARDTTLCCPPHYHCVYRPDAGLNQFGSYWWCINDTNKNQGGEPKRCN